MISPTPAEQQYEDQWKEVIALEASIAELLAKHKIEAAKLILLHPNHYACEIKQYVVSRVEPFLRLKGL